MSKKFYNIKTAELSATVSINFMTQDTSYGFRHLAELTERTGTGADYKVSETKAKSTYYNRTWESFDYESVGHKVIQKHFDKNTAEVYCGLLDSWGNGESEKQTAGLFNMVNLAMTAGSILTDSQAEKNAWDKKMLSAMPGVSFPDNWDTLSEEEKTKRLDQVKSFIKEDK